VLVLDGMLQITADDGQSIDVSASGSHLRAEIGSLTVRRPTLRMLKSGFALARRLAAVLDRQRLTLVVTRDGKPVAEFGSGVRGGVASWLLRMPRVRLYWRT